MSIRTAKQHDVELEDSELWRIAISLESKVRAAVKSIPYGEHYRMADGPLNTSAYLVVAIAKIIGKSPDAAAYDYRYARAELFATKGMLLIARKHKYLHDIKDLINDINTLQTMLEKELRAIVSKDKTEVS